MTVPTVYVSITGFRIKRGFIPHIRFWWFAVRSMMQARKSDGNLSADARQIDGVQHTLTVWRDRKAMRAFMLSEIHAKAMAVQNALGVGMVLGFEADGPPDWSEVPALLREHGRTV